MYLYQLKSILYGKFQHGKIQIFSPNFSDSIPADGIAGSSFDTEEPNCFEFSDNVCKVMINRM